jgi:tellurite resistance protein TerC
LEYPLVFWIGFHVLILSLLAIDLGIFHRRPHVLAKKEALLFSLFWIFLALLFNGFVYIVIGPEAGLQFFTGYLIEKSLSVDNLFVFLLIFTSFKIPPILQHKVLFWGILGAILFRIAMILTGVALIREFHFVIYLLGALILYTGIKFACQKEKPHPEQSFIVKLAQKFLPLSEQKESRYFFVREQGKWKMTILFLVHLIVESSDIVFALDSIPAIFAVTTDPFIIYTSNIFAILGLRSLYFVLVGYFYRLRYFKYGLAAILAFIGLKMLCSKVISIPLPLSLIVIIALLAITTIVSLNKTDNQP